MESSGKRRWMGMNGFSAFGGGPGLMMGVWAGGDGGA